jgi:hypothetical protein
VKFKMRYDGSTLGLYVYVLFILTVLLAPLGILMLLDNITIYELQHKTERTL